MAGDRWYFRKSRGRRLAYALLEHLERNDVKEIYAQEIRVDSILDALCLVACMLDQCWSGTCSAAAATRRA